MPKRFNYDLGHYIASAGELGCLMCPTITPVVAGDSIDMKLQASLRLSPLRRALVLDQRVDMAAFFVPYRHIYGTQWETAVKNGISDDTMLTGAIPSSNGSRGYAPSIIAYSGRQRNRGVSIAYNMVWNNYYRIPNVDNDDVLPEDGGEMDSKYWKFGHPVARLPRWLTTGSSNDVDALTYEVDAAGDSVSLLDIQSSMALLKSETDRTYFAHRYKDYIQDHFGTKSVNVDADQRPRMLWHSTDWLSGYDVDGTDDATLGTYAGKSQGLVSFNMPSQNFNEHGLMLFMVTVRTPPIFNSELHKQIMEGGIDKPLYESLSGDPRFVGMKKPETTPTETLLYNTSANQGGAGFYPYYTEFRTHPNQTHDIYRTAAGFPFIDYTANSTYTAAKFSYEDPSKLASMFTSTELGHWQMIGRCDSDSYRVIPPAAESLFAGSD